MALSGQPPSQPYDVFAQSTNYYSERSSFVALAPCPLLNADSIAPTAANAQHDPQFPWFLTFVNVDQSAEAAGALVGIYSSNTSSLETLAVK